MLFLSEYMSKNPGMRVKFHKKNEDNDSDFQLFDGMISWNIRRFSVGIIEFVDRGNECVICVCV